MGEVYLADDTLLQRKVALKFLPAELQTDGQARQRFLHEAKSAAALDHPYICHINEVGEADGKNFIVMEYVEGQTLQKRLEQGPMPLEEVLEISLEITEALEEAHKKGIIHRDLKPANIMVAHSGHAKVMDYGLAKRMMPQSSPEDQEQTLSAMTQSGTILGTLAYMSPEQLQAKPADSRSDLFSFGIVLYEMLTGLNPFSRASMMETASAILTATPPALDHYQPEAPSQLQAITKKLLAKNPLDRYQSARELRSDLNQIPHHSQQSSKRRRPSRPIWVAITLIIFALGVAPLSWWVRESYFKSPQAALAFQERDWILIADVENSTGDPIFDRSLQTAMTVGIQQSRYINVFPPGRVQEALKRMRKESGAKLGEELACEIAVREGIKAVLVCSISSLGEAYSLTARLVSPGNRDTVLSQAATATGRNQVLSTLDSLINSIRQNLGESLSTMSSQNLPLPKATTASLEALKTYTDGITLKQTNDKAAFDLIEQAVNADPDFSLAHAELGIACYRGEKSGGRAKGEEHFNKALSQINRLTLRERLWIRAVIEDFRGNSDKATEAYNTFLTQYPDDRDGWFNLGWLYMARQGKYEKAIGAFRRVLEINPANSSSYINLGTCYSGLQKFEEAKRSYEKGFEITPSNILGYNINTEYGFTLVSVGEIQKAASTFQKMIAADEVLRRARGFRSLGFLAIYQGKLSDAIANFKRAILINKSGNASDSEFRDHLFLASAYQLKGLKADFLSELEAADRLLSKESFDPAFIEELATLYARAGKISNASRLLSAMSSQAKNLTATSMLNRSVQGDQASISEVQGEIALAKGKASEAIECFELADNLELRLMRDSIAMAYHKLGKLEDAAASYRAIIDKYRLSGVLVEQWVLAHYELAGIYDEMGEHQKAKEYYGKFLSIWKDADPDIPILRQAKAEYAKL
jgi:eukaryotic-like serine/threonine-protein kinase